MSPAADDTAQFSSNKQITSDLLAESLQKTSSENGISSGANVQVPGWYDQWPESAERSIVETYRDEGNEVTFLGEASTTSGSSQARPKNNGGNKHSGLVGDVKNTNLSDATNMGQISKRQNVRHIVSQSDPQKQSFPLSSAASANPGELECSSVSAASGATKTSSQRKRHAKASGRKSKRELDSTVVSKTRPSNRSGAKEIESDSLKRGTATQMRNKGTSPAKKPPVTNLQGPDNSEAGQLATGSRTTKDWQVVAVQTGGGRKSSRAKRRRVA